MPRYASSAQGPAIPGPGLRALAELILDVLCANVLAAGGAGPSAGSALIAPMAIDTSAARHRTRRIGSKATAGAPDTETAAASGATGGATGPAGHDGPGPEPIDEEHVETWRLVALAQDGDGEAFGQLYDRYVDTVFRFIYFRVNDRALAEDFTSETFLRALRRISTISYQGRDIGAWFVTIARNIVFDYMKSARHRLEISTADTIERNDAAPGPEAVVIESLTSERLMAAVQQLGDEQCECVMLRFIQGFSVSETAAVMGKNDGAIKALQHRAVRKLAELVGRDLA